MNDKRYRRVSLDTAADEQPPSDMERSLGKLMRELPTMGSERGMVRRTKNGNLVTVGAR